MSDLYDRVTSQQDIFKKLLSKIPGLRDMSSGETAGLQINC